MTYEYSDIKVAQTLIHEVIHAFIGEAYETFSIEDDDHDYFNKYRNFMVGALTDFVRENNLSYTAADIEDLSWSGVETTSKSFNDHFEELAKKNNTTKDEEIKAWGHRIDALAYVKSEWQEKK